MYKLTTPPTTEPVTLAELQAHVLGYNANDSAYLTTLIGVARKAFENMTGLHLQAQTWTLTLPQFPRGAIQINKAPVRSISTVKYYDGANTQQTLASSRYLTDFGEYRSLVSEAPTYSWPSTITRPDAVEVTFLTGIYDASSPPVASYHADRYALAKQAIMILCDHLYRNRGLVAPVALHETPMAFQMIVNQCRVNWA